jgi:hypothetical protein
MKTTITVDFSDLRRATIRVLNFTKNYVQDKNINLRTSIAEDLSLWELDGHIFLDQFQSDFNVQLPDIAYEYITPDALKVKGPKKVLYGLGNIILMPIFLLIYPFIPKNRREKIRDKIRYNKKRLTLGDLAATIAVGHFIKREDVIISTDSTRT